MNRVVIYTTAVCPFCVNAKRLLARKSVEPEEIRVDREPGLREKMIRDSGGQRTVPQIWIGDQHVGGFSELAALDQRGELDTLLRG